MKTGRVKLILTYDILADTQDRYYQYVLGEMVPAVQALGLKMSGAWHTVYGAYPVRLVEFVAEDLDQMLEVLHGGMWEKLERRLKKFVINYNRKVVLQRDRFQF